MSYLHSSFCSNYKESREATNMNWTTYSRWFDHIAPAFTLEQWIFLHYSANVWPISLFKYYLFQILQRHQRMSRLMTSTQTLLILYGRNQTQMEVRRSLDTSLKSEINTSTYEGNERSCIDLLFYLHISINVRTLVTVIRVRRSRCR